MNTDFSTGKGKSVRRFILKYNHFPTSANNRSHRIGNAFDITVGGRIGVDAVFKNPNDVGGTLKTDGLRVLINDTEVATIVSEAFDVPSKNNFTIPLIVSVSTDSLVDRNSLGSLLGSLISQKLKVRYKGEIDYKVFGYSSSYKVDEEQNIKVKL